MAFSRITKVSLSERGSSRRALVVLAVCSAAAWASSFCARERTFSYTPIDVPSATLTGASGINAGGEVVGQYRDATGNTHGFVRRGEIFASIDFPEAAYTDAQGIGPAGDVVGSYRMAGEPTWNGHGYLLTRQGQFSQVDAPGHTATMAHRLLPDGTILGCYHDDADHKTMHGMRVTSGAFNAFDRGSTMHTGGTPDGRTIVGFTADIADINHNRGYMLEGTTFTPLDVLGSRNTWAWDINPSGAIVGAYEDPAGKFHGFIREAARYTTIDVPGATATYATGIDPGGAVVGAYVDASAKTHGFVASRRR